MLMSASTDTARYHIWNEMRATPQSCLDSLGADVTS